MKKIVFGLALAIPLVAPAVAQDVTFKISHFLPSAAPAQQQVMQPWCDDLNKASDGRINCQFYPAMQLGGNPGQLADQALREIAELDDIKGLKLRTPTRMASKVLTALGGEPVSMPPGQVTEAITKGVVDGAMGAWEVVLPTKLDEVTKYHSQLVEGETYPSATVLVLLMNQQKFDSLDSELQKIIDEHSGLSLVQKFGQVWDDYIDGAICNPRWFV